MVLYSQTTQTTSAVAVPAASTTNSVMANQSQPVVVVQSNAGSGGGCDCCSVPPNVSQAVKAVCDFMAGLVSLPFILATSIFSIFARFLYRMGFALLLSLETRCSSISVIITHTIALIIFGWGNWAQWIASLFGIIMGSVLLCNFNKCCYITASVLYSVAIAFDFIAIILWVVYGAAILMILPFLGIVSALIGAIAACMAVNSWNDSGATDVTVVQSGPVQVNHASVLPPTQATNVQPNYTYPVASKGPPPPYGV